MGRILGHGLHCMVGLKLEKPSAPEGGRGRKRSGPELGLPVSSLVTREAAVAVALTLAWAATLTAARAVALAASDVGCAVSAGCCTAMGGPGIRTGSEPGAQLSIGGGTGSSPVCHPGSAATSNSPGSRLRKLSCGLEGKGETQRRTRVDNAGVKGARVSKRQAMESIAC